MRNQVLLFVSTALCLLAPCQVRGQEQASKKDLQIDFARDVQPIFVTHCLKCHGPLQKESNYRLDSKEVAMAGGDFGEPAIVPGKSAISPLIRYVKGGDGELQMPPEGKGRPLTDAEVTTLRQWIDQGATWPDDFAGDNLDHLTTQHWSFQPICKPIVPTSQHNVVQNAIDDFIGTALEKVGLSPSPTADRRTLIRRLYLDMHGLPPTPEEVRKFVANDRPDAYERLVDTVLASPRYGERWAGHWLDVVRFAETTGFETNVPRPNAYHYRDYVIRAFNEDTPYDKFVREQLAGDAMGTGEATGFLVGGPNDIVKSPDINLTLMQRQDELADMVNTTGTTFLGLTLGCARCHNHKFDPILQKDYYSLQAVFAGVQHGERKIEAQRTADEEAELSRIVSRQREIETELSSFEPSSVQVQTIVMDDESSPPATSGSRGVIPLVPIAGRGIDIEGTSRGNNNDPGGADRFPNISNGRYSWWNEERGKAVMAYLPAATGRFHVWLSWGCGWNTHASDSVYVLDKDGKSETTADQRILAIVDQKRFADAAETPINQPLWSGLQYVGCHEFQASSSILLLAGKDGSATTADVIVLQSDSSNGKNQVADGAIHKQEKKDTESPPRWPQLRPSLTFANNSERFEPVAARYIRFTIDATSSSSEPCLDELEIWTTATESRPARNIAREAVGVTSSGDYPGNPKHKLEHINDGEYGNDRSWISNTSGRGWVMLELPEQTTIDRMVWQRDRKGDFLDRLPTDYIIEVAVEPDAWQVVSSSDDRLPFVGSNKGMAQQLWLLSPGQQRKATLLISEREELAARKGKLDSDYMAYSGTFTTPPAIHRLYRGDPMMPKEEVVPASLLVLEDILGGLGLDTKTPEQTRRLALAKWITNPANPLTARVLVNRIWHYHFGTGIVDTPSDFGANGGKPSHPELLDFLANYLIEHGWSMKSLHRLILLSHTYQQSDRPRPDALDLDAQCRLLWRFPPRRLEGEAIRDSIHAVSGVLNLSMYGAGYSLFKPNQNYVRVYEPKEEFGPAEWRRAIYATKVRMEHDDVFGAFDLPDGGQICPRRGRSTTAIQSLNLLNSSFIVQQSEFFAARLRREAGDDVRKQIELAFELTDNRNPDDVELAAGMNLISTHGLAAFCRAMLNTSEFLFLP